MKDYSLKINGQNYTVQIDEVNDASTVAHVVGHQYGRLHTAGNRHDPRAM